jgi:hypothetical protein
MERRFRWKCFACFSSALLVIGLDWTGIKAEQSQPSLSPRSACPTDLETLTTQLLEDLPNYTNRANARLGISNNYVIIASRPEFKPLPLGPGQRAAVLEKPVERNDPDQVFFTTLERSYQGGKSVQLQLYHWLFLTQTDSGWRFAIMYSMVGPYPAGYPPSPPQESSDGSIAGAIQTWLRDCRSESLDG